MNWLARYTNQSWRPANLHLQQVHFISTYTSNQENLIELLGEKIRAEKNELDSTRSLAMEIIENNNKNPADENIFQGKKP